MRARYGVYSHFIDVTNIVRHYAFPGGKMDVSNKTFGSDPFKGEKKQLHVVFHTPNGRYERDYDEGDTIRFAERPDSGSEPVGSRYCLFAICSRLRRSITKVLLSP